MNATTRPIDGWELPRESTPVFIGQVRGVRFHRPAYCLICRAHYMVAFYGEAFARLWDAAAREERRAVRHVQHEACCRSFARETLLNRKIHVTL